jgi:hypothetical protein
MKEDITERVRLSKQPDLKNEALEGVAVVDGWTFVSIGNGRLRNKGIRRANWVIAISTIDAYSTFAFSHGPLQGVEEETNDEVEKEFGENDMKRLGFFGRKFGFHRITIFGHFGMVVVLGSRSDFVWVIIKMTCQGNSLGPYALGAWEIRWRQLAWVATSRRIAECGEYVGPVP